MEKDISNQVEEEKKEENKEEKVIKMRRVPLDEWKVRFDYRYEIIKQVGQGAYGAVYKAKLKPQYAKNEEEENSYFALKKLMVDSMDDGFPITSLREIQYLKKLNHENIVNLEDVVVSYQEGGNEETTPDVYLVFQYMDYDISGLFNKKVKFTVEQIKCLMLQLLKGVEYLHDNDLMHRDIKAANILLDSSGTLKLADFGLAKKFDMFRKMYTNKVVTLWYRAPELLLGANMYSKNIDVWSLGCFFVELFTGKPFFPGDTEARQLDLIFRVCGTPTLGYWPEVLGLPVFQTMQLPLYANTLGVHLHSILEVFPGYADEDGIDLIAGMLALNPNKRLSVKQCLEHRYFNSLPYPCEKSELPKIEGEAHEHAVFQEKRDEIRKKKTAESGLGMLYPTSKPKDSSKPDIPRPYYAGKKRSYEERERGNKK